MNLVFLVEERSMMELLKGILPQIIPNDIGYRIIPHSGKSDLRKSIPNKIKNWNVPDSRFIILHDQDANDCVELKQELVELCKPTQKPVLIRIVCHELEAWYFGDLQAVSKAYGRDLNRISNKRLYRNPDSIQNPKQELRRLIPEHEQISGARKIAPYMDVRNNKSKSFNVFLTGLEQLVGI